MRARSTTLSGPGRASATDVRFLPPLRLEPLPARVVARFLCVALAVAVALMG
jgi:hypothetical protein